MGRQYRPDAIIVDQPATTTVMLIVPRRTVDFDIQSEIKLMMWTHEGELLLAAGFRAIWCLECGGGVHICFVAQSIAEFSISGSAVAVL